MELNAKMMNLLNNLKFKKKLILLILFPLFASLYFSSINLIQLTDKRSTLSQIQALITVTVANNALVHELQKERGATAVFLGSQGKKFSQELANQRTETDQALMLFNKKLSNFNSDYEQANSITSDIKGSLARLINMRSRIDKLSIPLSEAIGYYTTLNKIK